MAGYKNHSAVAAGATKGTGKTIADVMLTTKDNKCVVGQGSVSPSAGAAGKDAGADVGEAAELVRVAREALSGRHALFTLSYDSTSDATSATAVSRS